MSLGNNEKVGEEKLGENEKEINIVVAKSLQDRENKTTLAVNKKRAPVTLSWKNLTYDITFNDLATKSKKEKRILHNISGIAKPGELVAIMGPSGSGKTSLLNVLSGRIIYSKGASLTGTISINGMNKNKLGYSRFAKIASYVQQDDILLNMQTVTETLMTAAAFRLSNQLTETERINRVNSIISELGLNKAKDTIIGDSRVRGVSGGERKRVSIGIELIQDPSLLFLDEPTSGLDSFQALNVMESLKILCRSGVTVILSIHQPRSSIFALFDRLILLTDGNIVYNGGAGNEVLQYFDNLGFKCPSYFNPADYFLDVISRDNRSPDKIEQSTRSIDKLITSYSFKTEDKEEYDTKIFPELNETRSSYMDQIWILAMRNFQQIFRDKFTLGFRLIMIVFFSIILCLLYAQLTNEQESIQNRNGVLFFICIDQSFGGVTSTVSVFSAEKLVVMRERQSKSYHLSSYYLSKLLTQLPLDILSPVIFSCIIYWIIGFQDDLQIFLKFIIITTCAAISSIALGFIIAAVSPNQEVANNMVPLVLIVNILFGGFFVNSDTIPDYLSWIQYISTIKWSYTAFIINEFSGLEFDCNLDNCVSNGEQVIESFSFDDITVEECIMASLILFVVFHIFGYIILRFSKRKYLSVSEVDKQHVV